MVDSSALKLQRASRHIADLEALLNQEGPFSYIVETNTVTGDRSTFARRNDAVCNKAALIAGDAVHNIKSAIDHAYWDIVSPLVSEAQRRQVQFPFCVEEARLEAAVKNRLAHLVSEKFFETVKNVRPHSEARGNRILYLVDLLNNTDKHRLLVPTADYKRFTIDMIRLQVPDFPDFVGTATFGANRRDAGWTVASLDGVDLGEAVPPTTFMFERRLDMPVEIGFSIPEFGMVAPIVPTLNRMIEEVADTIHMIRLAAPPAA